MAFFVGADLCVSPSFSNLLEDLIGGDLINNWHKEESIKRVGSSHTNNEEKNPLEPFIFGHHKLISRVAL
jgi:hypothetical protein